MDTVLNNFFGTHEANAALAQWLGSVGDCGVEGIIAGSSALYALLSALTPHLVAARWPAFDGDVDVFLRVPELATPQQVDGWLAPLAAWLATLGGCRGGSEGGGAWTPSSSDSGSGDGGGSGNGGAADLLAACTERRDFNVDIRRVAVWRGPHGRALHVLCVTTSLDAVLEQFDLTCCAVGARVQKQTQPQSRAASASAAASAAAPEAAPASPPQQLTLSWHPRVTLDELGAWRADILLPLPRVSAEATTVEMRAAVAARRARALRYMQRGFSIAPAALGALGLGAAAAASSGGGGGGGDDGLPAVTSGVMTRRQQAEQEGRRLAALAAAAASCGDILRDMQSMRLVDC